MPANHRPWRIMALLAISTFVSLAGCACPTDETQASQPSCDVVQDKITQTYSASYDESSDTTTATAVFAWGNQGLQLGGASSVTFNGTTIPSQSNIWNHVTYSTTVKGAQSTNTFVFTDCNGKTYTNTLAANSFGFTAPSSVSIAAGFTLPFTGPATQSGETLTIFWELLSTQAVYETTAGSAEGWVPTATSINFPASFFSCSTSGHCAYNSGEAYALSFTRSMSSSLQQAGSAGGNISVSYRTKSQTVTLTQ